MFETSQQYNRIVQKAAILLKIAIGRPVIHGEPATCPRCGANGHFDLNALGFTHGITNSIYFSTVFNEWRCRKCDFQRCS